MAADALPVDGQLHHRALIRVVRALVVVAHLQSLGVLACHFGALWIVVYKLAFLLIKFFMFLWLIWIYCE